MRKLVLMISSVMLLTACSSPELKEITPGDSTGVSIAPPQAVEEIPVESPRVTVRVIGHEDNVFVKLVDEHNNLVTSGMTYQGVASLVLPQGVSKGFHRVVVENQNISSATVVLRPSVTADQKKGRVAQGIAGKLTSEEAINLLGLGDIGGLNRNAVHTLPVSMTEKYGLYTRQRIQIDAGEGIESGTIKIESLSRLPDGQHVEMVTKEVSAASAITDSLSSPLDIDDPVVVTGKELVSKEVEDASVGGDAIAFDFPGSNPVMSITVRVKDQNGGSSSSNSSR